MPNSEQQLKRRASAEAGREARCALSQYRGLTKFIPDTNQHQAACCCRWAIIPTCLRAKISLGANEDRSKRLAQGKGHADQHFTEGTRMGLLPSGSSKERSLPESSQR